jgi:hypothetical protein
MCYPENRTKLGHFAYKFPPTPRVGLVWPRPHCPALILLFAKKFFRTAHAGTNEVDRTNILASGFTFFPPSPPKVRGLAQLGSCIQLQQRNCSRFARDFLRRSTFPSSQRTGSRSIRLRAALQDLFRSYPACVATNLRPSAIIAPSAASVSSCTAKA